MRTPHLQGAPLENSASPWRNGRLSMLRFHSEGICERWTTVEIG